MTDRADANDLTKQLANAKWVADQPSFDGKEWKQKEAQSNAMSCGSKNLNALHCFATQIPLHDIRQGTGVGFFNMKRS